MKSGKLGAMVVLLAGAGWAMAQPLANTLPPGSAAPLNPQSSAFSGATINGGTLNGATLSGGTLNGATFNGANLNGSAPNGGASGIVYPAGPTYGPGPVG